MSEAVLSEIGDNWVEDYVPYRLHRVTCKLNSRLVGKLKSLRINLSQWRVMSVLKGYGTLNMGSIVNLTVMEQPTVSRVVAQLAKMGMISRRPFPTDARITEVSLTAKGFDACEQIISTALRLQRQAFDGISGKEMASLLQTLAKIERNVEGDC